MKLNPIYACMHMYAIMQVIEGIYLCIGYIVDCMISVAACAHVHVLIVYVIQWNPA